MTVVTELLYVVAAGLFILAMMFLFSGVIEVIPLAALAGHLVVAALSLIDLRTIRMVWQVNAIGRVSMLATLIAALTLEQTEKLADRTAILLYGSEYWDPILDIGHLAEWGAISPEDPDLLIRVNSVDEALDALKRNLELHLASEEEDQMAPAISKTNR